MTEVAPVPLVVPAAAVLIVIALPLAGMTAAPIVFSPLLGGAVLSRALLLVVLAALLGLALALVLAALLRAAELLRATVLLFAAALFSALLLVPALVLSPALLGFRATPLGVPALFRSPLPAHVVALLGIVRAVGGQVCRRSSHAIVA
jgi:hypothetical protein